MAVGTLGWRWLLRALELGLPRGPVTAEDRRRARTLGAATLGLCALAPSTVVFYLNIDIPLLATLVGAAAIFGIANLSWLRHSGNFEQAGHGGMGILFTWLLVENLAIGGIHDPNFAWFHVVPLAAIQVLSLRGAGIWFGLTALTTLAFYAAGSAGWTAPLAGPLDERGLQALYNRLTSLAAFGVLAWGFIHAQRGAEREIRKEAAYVNLVRHTAVSASEADSFEQAVHDAAARIAREMGWMISQVYRVDAEGVSHWRSTPYLEPARREQLESTLALSRTRTHARGAGLPGRAVLSEEVVTLRTDEALRDAPRTSAARDAGIVSAFAVPILSHGRVVSVIEFGSARFETRDERLVGVLTHIGEQLGALAERTASSEARQMSHRIDSVGHVAAGLAHELNNPLAFSRTNLSQLSDALDTLDAKLPDDASTLEQRQLCDVLVREAAEGIERAIGIVRDVRKLSRLERGDFVPVDVGVWIREAVHFATVQAPEGIELSVVVPASVTIDGAPSLLHQAVVNLVENAVHALDGKGHITVEAHLRVDGLLVSVEDDGPGFDERIADRIFEPFATGRADGTGLGLYLVYGIVRSHRGRISAEAAASGGARFEMWLPKAQPDSGSA